MPDQLIGIERYAYKNLLRELKQLGLTNSLDVRYSIRRAAARACD